MRYLVTLLAGAVFGAAAMFFYLYQFDDGRSVTMQGPALTYPPAPPVK